MFHVSDIPPQKLQAHILWTSSCARQPGTLLIDFKSQGRIIFGIIFAEQQGLKCKSAQVLNRLVFLKFVMLSDIRRLV